MAPSSKEGIIYDCSIEVIAVLEHVKSASSKSRGVVGYEGVIDLSATFRLKNSTYMNFDKTVRFITIRVYS